MEELTSLYLQLWLRLRSDHTFFSLKLNISFKIEKQNDPAHSDFVEFEMGRETLQAMLDGLGKIRDQLHSVSS